MSNYTLWFLAILPPEEVAAEVRKLQQEIAERFGPRRALRIPVHITLEPPFRRDAADAEFMREHLTAFFGGESAFELELHDFGAFREDVVFIDVVASLPLLEMQQRLSNYLRAPPVIIATPPQRKGYKPHLTLANRDVEPKLHRQIWESSKRGNFLPASWSVPSPCCGMTARSGRLIRSLRC